MNMKKLATLLLALVMILAFVGCSTEGEKEVKEPATDAPVEDAVVEEEGDLVNDLYDIAQYKSDKTKEEWTIAVVTKDATSAWFQRMEEGVKQFAEETGINVIQKGPATPDAASQVQVIDDMISQGVDALCVVPIDSGALEASLEEAMKQGIVVVSHEASNLHNTLFDVEAFTAEDFGATMMDTLAGEMGEEGKYAMMVGYTTTDTHIQYAQAQKDHQVEAYPNMELINNGDVPSAESEESIETAYERAKEILKLNPDLRGFTGVASTDCPGIARAVEELGLQDQVKIVGVGAPNEFRRYIESGTISAVTLWDPQSAGYAMLDIAVKILNGEEVGAGSNLNVEGYESVTQVDGINRVLIGKADIIVRADNIDKYAF